jgi:hypothetical protein
MVFDWYLGAEETDSLNKKIKMQIHTTLSLKREAPNTIPRVISSLSPLHINHYCPPHTNKPTLTLLL